MLPRISVNRTGWKGTHNDKLNLSISPRRTAEIRDRVERELVEIHEHTAYIGGPQVAAFEKEFADISRRAPRHRRGQRNRRVAAGADGVRSRDRATK